MFVRKGDIWARYGASIAHQRMPEIVCADINASQIVLGLKNRMLLLLNLDNDDFHVHRGRQFDNEISAVSCTPLEDHKNYAAYFAVAFWRSDYVMIVSSASQALGEICKSPRLPAAPRSLLLHAFSEGNEKSQTHPHLLVGLVDGSVVTFVFRDEGNGQGKALMDMKCISIGTLPVSLHPAMIEGKDAVVACGSRSSVLCWDKEWLVHSPLMLKVSVLVTEYSSNQDTPIGRKCSCVPKYKGISYVHGYCFVEVPHHWVSDEVREGPCSFGMLSHSVICGLC